MDFLEGKGLRNEVNIRIFCYDVADEPATFMLIDNSTRYDTGTILFNIDSEKSIYKDKTAVLRVFAKIFFDHLVFFGENLSDEEK